MLVSELVVYLSRSLPFLVFFSVSFLYPLLPTVSPPTPTNTHTHTPYLLSLSLNIFFQLLLHLRSFPDKLSLELADLFSETLLKGKRLLLQYKLTQFRILLQTLLLLFDPRMKTGMFCKRLGLGLGLRERGRQREREREREVERERQRERKRG